MRRQHDVAGRGWNPYSWRLCEIAALGHDPADAARRQQLADELVCVEAAELARGVHHVSVVHGDPATVRGAEQLATFLGQIDTLIVGAEWSRRRGDSEHIIVAFAGADAAERIGHVVALAELSNPGHWVVAETARPDLTPLA
jgi:hypothetical protein